MLLCCWGLRGSPRASRASQGPRPSAVALSGPLVGRSAADAQRWRLQTCSRLAPDRVFEGNVEFRRFWRASPARSARPSAPRSRRPTARRVADDGRVSGFSSTSRDGVDAMRGRRRRRRAQIVSSGAKPGEERERRGCVSLEIILGDDLFFCLCTSIVWPRVLVRAFDSVLEARGLRRGARAFCGVAGHAASASMAQRIERRVSPRAVASTAGTPPGAFFIDKERRSRRQNLIGSRIAIGHFGGSASKSAFISWRRRTYMPKRATAFIESVRIVYHPRSSFYATSRAWPPARGGVAHDHSFLRLLVSSQGALTPVTSTSLGSVLNRVGADAGISPTSLTDRTLTSYSWGQTSDDTAFHPGDPVDNLFVEIGVGRANGGVAVVVDARTTGDDAHHDFHFGLGINRLGN